MLSAEPAGGAWAGRWALIPGPSPTEARILKVTIVCLRRWSRTETSRRLLAPFPGHRTREGITGSAKRCDRRFHSVSTLVRQTPKRTAAVARSSETCIFHPLLLGTQRRRQTNTSKENRILIGFEAYFRNDTGTEIVPEDKADWRDWVSASKTRNW